MVKITGNMSISNVQTHGGRSLERPQHHLAQLKAILDNLEMALFWLKNGIDKGELRRLAGKGGHSGQNIINFEDDLLRAGGKAQMSVSL